MSTPPPQPPRRSAGDAKKVTPPATSIVTRNGARKAKIQTRAMSAGVKPSASLLAAKKKAQQKKKSSFNIELKDPYQIAMDSKTKVRGPTGFVTEPRMAEHRCLWDDNYPECPERLIQVIDRCNELNLIEQCKQYPPRAATEEELSVLHSPSIYRMLESTHNNEDLEYLEDLSSKYDSIYIHPSTHELALLAAGSTIDLVDRVVSGELQNGAAFVRPPGHHAMRAEPCGYCFYNNVALAARHALDKRGLNRILIVDWDVHHGQATQQMFYNDPRVLYFSVHRYEHGAFWPSLRQADYPQCGGARGRGYTCNVPLNATGAADADYIAVWHQLLLPMAFEYAPELIIISAGYDAALGCPEGEMEVTPACYASLVHMLGGVCGALCVVLEGGYCLPALAEGAAHTLRALLGHAPPALPAAQPSDQIRETILNCIYVQKRYWNCFKYQPTYSTAGAPNVCDAGKEKHTVSVRWEGDETRPERFETRNCYPIQDDETKRNIMKRLNHLREVTDLSIPEHAVSYVYDEAMLKHKNICEPGHPECPERIMRIHERHLEFGLLSRVQRLPARRALDADILAVHTEQHLNLLKELATTKLRDLHSQKNSFDSVYFHPDTLESASVAAGCVIQGVESVLSGASGACVCVVRPPGHHAERGAPAGFCVLNNVCVGARHALRAHGLRRVLLLDWDVHHGNGTQRITYEDDTILYISIHRYDHGAFFPHSRDADHGAVGRGEGEGFNVNIPWNKRGMGDTEYLAAFTQIVLPIAYEYSPQLVLVSAGFDACVGDPLGGCKVSPECFGRMTHLLRGLAGGRLVLCLEGGYNLTSVAYAAAMCTKALLADPPPAPAPPAAAPAPPAAAPHPSAVDSINDVIRTHSKYWKSLKFQLALPAEDVLGPNPPSRGLDEDRSPTILDNSERGSSPLQSLESHMAALNIETKCSDGVHCGTDDEEDARCSKSKNVDRSDAPKSGKSCDGDGSSAEVQGSSEVAASSEQGTSKEQKRTLVDYLAENMHAIVEGEMFAVIPLQWCPHLDTLYAIPADVSFQQGRKCIDCDHTLENWVCLHCYVTACARSINAHMQAHYASTGHPLVLSLADLSVWCNECDAYVDNQLLYDAKNNAHRHKFGEDMPWCYKADDTIQME